MAADSQPDDGSDRSEPAAGDEHLSRRADLYDHELRADLVWHARAQSPALWPLVGAAADRFPAALQQCLSRRHNELSVRHRALALGARCLGRKSTRLNSSHANSSYAVFCLKKQ